MSSSDVRRVIAELEEMGYQTTRMHRHRVMHHPSGAMMTVPISPSDQRWILNNLAEARRRIRAAEARRA